MLASDKYKKEKFVEKYKAAYDNLDDLKEAINEYKKTNNKIIKRAIPWIIFRGK